MVGKLGCCCGGSSGGGDPGDPDPCSVSLSHCNSVCTVRYLTSWGPFSGTLGSIPQGLSPIDQCIMSAVIGPKPAFETSFTIDYLRPSLTFGVPNGGTVAGRVDLNFPGGCALRFFKQPTANGGLWEVEATAVVPHAGPGAPFAGALPLDGSIRAEALDATAGSAYRITFTFGPYSVTTDAIFPDGVFAGQGNQGFICSEVARMFSPASSYPPHTPYMTYSNWTTTIEYP